MTITNTLELNLVDKNKGNINYQIDRFPDGQSMLFLKDSDDKRFLLSFLKEIKMPVTIKSRFNSYDDLNLIACAKACLNRLGIEEVHLFIPYMFGARADRQFTDGGCSYMVDVMSKFLNNLNFKTITVVDIHSDVTPACIPNINNISYLPNLTDMALNEINKKCYIVSPDSGASKRTFETAKQLKKHDFSIIECAKHRDLATGKILETVVPKDDFEGMDCVIVDDISSRGGTFMGIASKLKEKNAGDIYLVVAHYEGTADVEQFKASGIKKVFTTNSISDLTEEKYQGFIQQINIF
jgi:ribose-phosphate pyrophosphokinase